MIKKDVSMLDCVSQHQGQLNSSTYLNFPERVVEGRE
jgi:hypothetical protein